MKKGKTYPARLILFADEFSESLPIWLNGFVEEYDLTSPTVFQFCKEARILNDYVSSFDRKYKQARIVYIFNEKGLLLHKLHTQGPCFKIATSADSQMLKRYSDQLYRYLEIDKLCFQSRMISMYFFQRTKLPKTNNLKKSLDLSFKEFEGCQIHFLHLVKKSISEFIDPNFSV